MAIDCIDEVSGANELATWFGTWPSFHDAYIRDFSINHAGFGTIRIRAFRVTSELDARGYFVLDKHFFANLYLEEIQSVELEGFAEGATIIFSLDITRRDGFLNLCIETVDGMSGEISMKRMRITFEPVESDGSWPPN